MRILRILPAAVAVGVGAAGLVSAPAQASLTSPQLTAGTYFSHASTCTSTVSGGSSTTTFSDDGNAVSQNQSSSGSVANGSDVTQVAAAGQGTVKVTRSGSSLATATISGTTSAKAVPSASSTTCAAFTEGYTTASFGFNVAHSGWLTASTTGSSSGYTVSVLSVTGSGTGSYLQSYGTRTVGTNQIYLPQAGAYTLTVEYLSEAAAATTGYAQRASLALSTHIAYTVAGGAAGPASGAGAAYVTLAGARNCSGGDVAGTFTAKASKVKTAVFSINGVNRKTVQHPSAGTSAIVGGLSSSAPVTFRAVLTLKAGGSVAVSRTYLPCT